VLAIFYFILLYLLDFNLADHHNLVITRENIFLWSDKESIIALNGSE